MSPFQVIYHFSQVAGVEWHLPFPEARGKMIPAERQQRILQLLAERGVVSIVELTDWLQVSHMTIRRDIQKLEEQGRVLSVSGGVSLSSGSRANPHTPPSAA
jgi:DeoR/GlpR family transcriptional regulator of sugar metabolism